MAEEKREKVVLAEGRLRTGRRYEIVRSDKSAVTVGQHAVVVVLGAGGNIMDHDSLTYDEKGEACSILMRWLDYHNLEGRWTMGLNGKGVTVRPTFHPHGIISEASGQLLRLVHNNRQFVDNLKAAIAKRSWQNVEELAAQFESNLK